MYVNIGELTINDKSTVYVEHRSCPEAHPVRAKWFVPLRHSNSKSCDQGEGSQHNRRNAGRQVLSAATHKRTHGELVQMQVEIYQLKHPGLLKLGERDNEIQSGSPGSNEPKQLILEKGLGKIKRILQLRRGGGGLR